MLRSRFLWKLFAAYSAVILVSHLAVGVLIGRNVEADALEEVRRSLRSSAALLEDFLRPPIKADLQERIAELGRRVEMRLTLISPNGRVLADSEESPANMDNHADRPEVLAAGKTNEGLSIRWSETVETRMMYLAMRFSGGAETLGYVRTSLPLERIDRHRNHLRALIAGSAGLSALVSLLLGLLLTRHFVKPIIEMTEAAEAMSMGEYDRKISIDRADEIGELARALNRMAQRAQKRRETILADRNKLSAILSGMTEGVVAVDANERVVHMNAAAGRLLGAQPEASLDRPIGAVTRVREATDLLTRALRGDADVGMEEPLRQPSPSGDRYMNLHATPLRDGQGDLVGAVAVLQDVSDLYRMEGAQRDFVANASHELKTPIAAIRGLVETILDDEGLEEEKRVRFLEKIKVQSLRLSSVVTDLLTLSRLETPGDTRDEEPIDLCPLVRRASGAFESIAEEKRISLEVVTPQQQIEIKGEAEAIGQAVSNLLDNALKYTPEGGEVRVALTSEGSKAILEVRDTGVGIEKKHQERVFDRFFRVDKARSRRLGGTGLGLAIVQRIADEHGGSVELESALGKGSTFRLILPTVS